MTSKRATVALRVALVVADFMSRLLDGGVFALCVVAALIVAILAQLSILGVAPSPVYEIVIGLALGFVASGVIKYLVFRAFA
jgi:hypothetical protein